MARTRAIVSLAVPPGREVGVHPGRAGPPSSAAVNRSPSASRTKSVSSPSPPSRCELAAERRGLERYRRRRCPVVASGERGSIVASAGGVDRPGPEPDRGPVALADGADAHDEAQAPGGHARLVGVGDDARVAQRRAFDGVLAREGRAEQQPPRARRASGPGRAGRRPRSAWRRNVPSRSRWRPSNRATTSSRAACDLVLVQGEEAGQHRAPFGSPAGRSPPGRGRTAA